MNTGPVSSSPYWTHRTPNTVPMKVFGSSLPDCVQQDNDTQPARICEWFDQVFVVHPHEFVWWTHHKHEDQTIMTHPFADESVIYQTNTLDKYHITMRLINKVAELSITAHQDPAADETKNSNRSNQTWLRFSLFLLALGELLTNHPPLSIASLARSNMILTEDAWKRYTRFQLGRNCLSARETSSYAASSPNPSPTATIWEVDDASITDCVLANVATCSKQFYIVPDEVCPSEKTRSHENVHAAHSVLSKQNVLQPGDIMWTTDGHLTVFNFRYESGAPPDIVGRPLKKINVSVSPVQIDSMSFQYSIQVTDEPEKRGSLAEHFLSDFVCTLTQYPLPKVVMAKCQTTSLFYPFGWQKLMEFFYPSDRQDLTQT